MYKLCQFDWIGMFLLSYATSQSTSNSSKHPKVHVVTVIVLTDVTELAAGESIQGTHVHNFTRKTIATKNPLKI